VAKRISAHDETLVAPIAAAPPLFDPGRAYTNREIASALKVHLRTTQRWREQKKLPGAIELSHKIRRTPGHLLNQWWHSLLKNSEEEAA
jgi:hypothetical protein